MTFGNVSLYPYFRIQTASSPVTYTIYEEDSLHRPLFKAPTLSTDDPPWPTDYLYSFDDVTPRKTRELSEMELPIDHSEFESVIFGSKKTPHCICIKPDRNKKDLIVGWIDRTEAVVTKGPKSNTRIFWHVDYYLTGEYFRHEYLRQRLLTPPGDAIAKYGYGRGRLKRGPPALARPDPSEPRRWVQDSAVSLTGTTDVWVVIAYTISDGAEPPNTTLSYLTWKIGATVVDGGNTYQAPSIDQLYAGLTEELLGLDPAAIIGAWLSPIEIPYAGAGVQHHNYGGVEYGAYKHGIASQYAIYIRDIGVIGGVATDDVTKYVFTDASGTEMFTAPWGLNWRYWLMQVDYGASGCNLQIYLMDEAEYGDGTNTYSKSLKAEEGRLFSFPLPALPITENAWQSYNYSGQREYDIQAREMQKNQNAVNGISGVATGAITGAIAGSLVAPGPGTAIGAIAGVGASIIGTEASYFSTAYYDIKTQQAVDKLTASQTAGMIITAGGIRGLKPFGKGGDIIWQLVTMQRDATSKSEIEDEQDALGYVVDAYLDDCTTVITTGGGIRIEGLEVLGDLPKEGKAYISALFARGVHIDILT